MLFKSQPWTFASNVSLGSEARSCKAPLKLCEVAWANDLIHLVSEIHESKAL